MKHPMKLTISVLFLLLLVPVSQLFAQGKPVHVEPAHPKDAVKGEEKDKWPAVSHGHMIELPSPNNDDVWLYSKQQMDRWNARCDRLLHSTGALGRIVRLDLDAGAEAPYHFATCKQAYVGARTHADIVSIIALDRMRETRDEPGLEAVERLLNAAHEHEWRYTSATMPLRYLAHKASKRCTLQDFLIPFWTKNSPQGTTNTPEGRDYQAFLELLGGVAWYNYKYPSATSDDAGLNDALSNLRREALDAKNDPVWRRNRLLALDRGAATLRSCFKR